MLKDILSVSGKPGLFRLIKTGKTNFVAAALVDKRRVPIHANERVVSLREISIYTEGGETSLGEVLDAIYAHEGGKEVDLSTFGKDGSAYFDYFAKVLPDYDKDMVHDNEIKKILKWYNLLVANGYTEFKNKEEEDSRSEEEQETPVKEEV